MAHSRLVKDVMVPAVRLPSNSYAVDALRSMMEAHAEYGVICDESGTPSSIISRDQLRVAKPGEIVQALATHIPYPVTVRSDDSLSSMIEMLAENTPHTYDSVDIIVQMGDVIEGIVPHQVIEQDIWGTFENACLRPPLTSSIRTTGNPRTKPPEKVVYRCSICYREREIEYKKFSRTNPPVCHGQPMVFVTYKF